MIQPTAHAPLRELACAPRAPGSSSPAPPLDLYQSSEPRPNRLWGVPVVAASTAAAGGLGALSGLCVKVLGPWGLPAGLAAGMLVGGGSLGALALSGQSGQREAGRLASLGAGAGFSAALVGGVAARFAAHPVAVGGAAAAVAALAVSAWLTLKD